jgi:hypothetical protein
MGDSFCRGFGEEGSHLDSRELAQFAGERAGALHGGVGNERDYVHTALGIRKTEPPDDLVSELAEQFIDVLDGGYVPFHHDGDSTEPLFHRKRSRESDVVWSDAGSLPVRASAVNSEA